MHDFPPAYDLYYTYEGGFFILAELHLSFISCFIYVTRGARYRLSLPFLGLLSLPDSAF